jgi:hypothetical protein
MKTALPDRISAAGWKLDCRTESVLPDEKLYCRMKILDDCFEKTELGAENENPSTLNPHKFLTTTPILIIFSPNLIDFLSSTQWAWKKKKLILLSMSSKRISRELTT